MTKIIIITAIVIAATIILIIIMIIIKFLCGILFAKVDLIFSNISKNE